jgi:hypothetical protein
MYSKYRITLSLEYSMYSMYEAQDTQTNCAVDTVDVYVYLASTHFFVGRLYQLIYCM